jgi:hypothetical protein
MEFVFVLFVSLLERFQSKALLLTVDSPRYVPNTLIRRDFQTPAVKEAMSRYSSHYTALASPHIRTTPFSGEGQGYITTNSQYVLVSSPISDN